VTILNPMASPARGRRPALLRPALLRTAHLFAASLLLLLSALAGPRAAAQFNGPALPPGAGVNRPTTLTTDPAILYPAGREIVLGIGDLLSVHVYGPVDYSPTVRIGLDGKTQLPLIGIVSLQGLTITAAENLIATRLMEAGMYRDPQVTVVLTERPSASVSVIGEIHSVVPVLTQRRLFDILAVAGGLPATASHVITIDRPGLPQPIIVDLGTDPARSALANIPVFPGDTIIVSRVGVVYVIGSFKTVGAVPLTQSSPLTLMQLAALSGGPNIDAKYGDLRLIRTVGNQRTVVKLNIKDILYGKAPDPVMQSDDILFLPPSILKSVVSAGSIGTLLGVASLMISVLRY
jgi:polysaccharide export outer membrane protein